MPLKAKPKIPNETKQIADVVGLSVLSDQKIQMDGASIPHEVVRATNVYVASYFMVFFISVLVLGIDNLDFTTNFTAVAATFNNIGPGMELVGPASNYSIFSPLCKCIRIFDMLAGRLEIFPILMLFSRRSWKRL